MIIIIIILIIILIILINCNNENFLNTSYIDILKSNKFNSFYSFLNGPVKYYPLNNNLNNNNNVNVDFDINTNISYDPIELDTVIIKKTNRKYDDSEDLFNNRVKLKNNNISYYPINKNETNELNEQNNLKTNKCCLVSKVLNRDTNNIGKFKYNFYEFSGADCNSELFNLDHNNQLLYDGVNEWKNEYCKNDLEDQYIGSCRRNNFECVDFMTEKECNKVNTINNRNNFLLFPNDSTAVKTPNYKTKWSKSTCYDKIDEPSKYTIPMVNIGTNYGLLNLTNSFN